MALLRTYCLLASLLLAACCVYAEPLGLSGLKANAVKKKQECADNAKVHKLTPTYAGCGTPVAVVPELALMGERIFMHGAFRLA